MLERKRRYKTVQKVTAFVTRDFPDGRCLLVLQHPYVGHQLPAGTVDLGEKPRAAVLREVSEESGLVELTVVQELDSVDRILEDDERVVLRMTKIFDEPAYDASSAGYALTRGSFVRLINSVGLFSEIEAEPLDLSQDLAERLTNIRGFVRSSLLGLTERRYFYHLEALDQTEEPWTHFTDGLTLACNWAKVNGFANLAKNHQAWLDRYLPLLLK